MRFTNAALILAFASQTLAKHEVNVEGTKGKTRGGVTSKNARQLKNKSGKSGKKSGKKGGNFDIPYTPECDAFLLAKDTSSNYPFFVTNPDHCFQLLATDEQDDGWCNAVGCTGEYKSVAMFGEQIDNGFKIEFASDDFGGSWELVCPFGGLTPEVTDTDCVESGSPSSDVSFGTVQGPYGEFSGGAGCEYYAITVECTTNDDDLLDDIFKAAKRCEAQGVRPYSDNKFLVNYESTDSDDVFFVDGIDYTIEFLRGDQQESRGCTPTACTGEYWSAYVNGVDTEDGTKYIMSVADSHDWGSFNFICPYADQEPDLNDYYCNGGGTVSLTTFDTHGPVVEDIALSLSGCDGVSTIEIECK